MNKRELTKLQTELVTALRSFNTLKAREIIRLSEHVLTFRNDENYAVLDILADDNKHTAAVEWICKEMKSKNLSIDASGDDGMSALQRAYLLSKQRIQTLLLKYTNDPNLKEWLVKRQLVTIFGSNTLQENNLYINSRLSNVADGGTSIEATQIFASAIHQFAKTKKNYAGIVSHLMEFNQTSKNQTQADYDSTNLIKQADNQMGQQILFQSGYNKHGFICGLKKNSDGTYQLSIYDDNEMSLSPRNFLSFWLLGNIIFVRKSIIAATEIREVINVLAKNFNTTQDTMLQWIDNLPAALNTRFHYDNKITFNFYTRESNRCFWNNPQYAILDYFIETLGEANGKRDFAEFMLFVKQQALNHFTETFAGKCNELAIKKIVDIIAKDKKNLTANQYPTKKILIGAGIMIALAIITVGIIIPFPPVVAALAPIVTFILLAPVPLFYFAKIAAEATNRFLRIWLGIGAPVTLTGDEKISIASSYRHIKQIMPTANETTIEPAPPSAPSHYSPLFVLSARTNPIFDYGTQNVELWPVETAKICP